MSVPPDSPGVPPSANAHQLFKGFSFVATTAVEDHKISPLTNILPIVQVTITFGGNFFGMSEVDQHLEFTVCSMHYYKMCITKMPCMGYFWNLEGELLFFWRQNSNGTVWAGRRNFCCWKQYYSEEHLVTVDDSLYVFVFKATSWKQRTVYWCLWTEGRYWCWFLLCLQAVYTRSYKYGVCCKGTLNKFYCGSLEIV